MRFEVFDLWNTVSSTCDMQIFKICAWKEIRTLILRKCTEYMHVLDSFWNIMLYQCAYKCLQLFQSLPLLTKDGCFIIYIRLLASSAIIWLQEHGCFSSVLTPDRVWPYWMWGCQARVHTPVWCEHGMDLPRTWPTNHGELRSIWNEVRITWIIQY